MENCRFTIIIPNYNNAEWLKRTFESIWLQSYRNYDVIFVDDCSTDESAYTAHEWLGRMIPTRQGFDNECCVVELSKKKRWNGGSRNVAMENELFGKGDYAIFMDSDDWFSSGDCLEEIAKALEANNYPDLLRLSYYTLIGDNLSLCDLSGQQTVERIVADQNVACWTKCVKTEKLVSFPENTLMEDVVQHIKQMDNVETVASINKGIIVWNRNNNNSCSRDETLQNGKWKSSLYRYYADLLDLEVKNPACQAELERRRAVALDNIKNDRFVQ